MRKLASVRIVHALEPIENADFIELAIVDGWQCIVKKGEFQPGDKGVYFEIDSALPADDERYEFLHKGSLKNLDGVNVVRIKTMKMKGQISQGLMMPLSMFPEIDVDTPEDEEVTEVLRVRKYEKEFSTKANTASSFPHFIRKTDQERIQNEFKRLKYREDRWEPFAATLKLDGSSTTIFYTQDEKYKIENMAPYEDESGGQLILCSRNNVLYPDPNDRWYKGLANTGIAEALKMTYQESSFEYALQGELVGPGVQRNHENHDDYMIYLFAIWDVRNQCYLPFPRFLDFVQTLNLYSGFSTGKPVFHTPVLDYVNLSQFPDVQSYLEYAEKIVSPFSKNPEGVVFHSCVNDYSFKAISNKFLLKTGE